MKKGARSAVSRTWPPNSVWQPGRVLAVFNRAGRSSSLEKELRPLFSSSCRKRATSACRASALWRSCSRNSLSCSARCFSCSARCFSRWALSRRVSTGCPEARSINRSTSPSGTSRRPSALLIKLPSFAGLIGTGSPLRHRNPCNTGWRYTPSGSNRKYSLMPRRACSAGFSRRSTFQVRLEAISKNVQGTFFSSHRRYDRRRCLPTTPRATSTSGSRRWVQSPSCQ